MCFFFQAEDGIRELVRSRGLGDVYKRQDQYFEGWEASVDGMPVPVQRVNHIMRGVPVTAGPVSYTHLTLPTSDLV